MARWAVETRSLTKRFYNHLAVDQLELKVPEGSIFGLMGPNGAGKTTIIKMLMGIIQPTAGKGFILGQDIGDKTGEVRHRVGYVPDFPNLYPRFQVKEILEFCRRTYRYWDSQRCNQLMKVFQLPLQLRIQALSKGMKTHLALVVALSIRPQLLILDEPTSALDPVVRRLFLQAVVQEAATNGTTVLYSTHQLSDLERIADHLALLNQGQLLFCRSIENLKASIRGLQVVFSEGIPAEIENLPGVIGIEARGKVFTLIIDGNYPEIQMRIEKWGPIYCENIDLSLEDIFIYTMKKEGYSHETPLLE